jgi:hypothetical protein
MSNKLDNLELRWVQFNKKLKDRLTSRTDVQLYAQISRELSWATQKQIELPIRIPLRTQLTQ